MSDKNTHPDQEVTEKTGADSVEAEAAMTEPTANESDGVMAEQSDLIAQLEAAQNQAEDYLDSLQRERATFQNYKKRVERERAEQSKSIAGGLLLKLLPVLDDFYRAIEAVPETEQDDWYNGVTLILKKLERYLADQNVTEIDALGEQFDPNFHEAIGVDGDSDAESGTITQVMLRGYQVGDRVLRPAMVRVAE